MLPIDGSKTGDESTGEGVDSKSTVDPPTGQETPEGSCQLADNPEVSAFPVQKRYGHFGKRRRSYTDEMFRCQFVDMISRSELVCNHLLWKSRPDDLRDHLTLHMDLALVQAMSDDDVRQKYTDAKKIFLIGIPEDCDDEIDNEEGDLEDHE